MMQPRQRLMSDNVKEEEVESKPLIYQELDDQELLDQQLQDALFGQLNDPSPGRAGSPRQRIHSDDGLFISGDDTMDEPSANADNNTRSMGFEMSASPAPSTMPQTTPAAARVETLDTGSALLLSPAPTSRTPTIPAGQVLSPSIGQRTIPPSEMAFLMTQTADQPRIPWRWSTTGKKESTPYKPTAINKWWYDFWLDSHKNPRIQSAASHVGRIA